MGAVVRHDRQMGTDETAFAMAGAVLWEERQHLEQLLYALVAQQLMLQSGHVRWMARADGEVLAALAQVRDSEVIRAIEIAGLAEALGLPADISLEHLALASPEPWSITLAEHCVALRSLAAEVDQTVARNRHLLQAAARALEVDAPERPAAASDSAWCPPSGGEPGPGAEPGSDSGPDARRHVQFGADDGAEGGAGNGRAMPGAGGASAKVGPANVGPAKVGPAKVGPAKVGPAESVVAAGGLAERSETPKTPEAFHSGAMRAALSASLHDDTGGPSMQHEIVAIAYRSALRTAASIRQVSLSQFLR